jgi:hypothetical protein
LEPFGKAELQHQIFGEPHQKIKISIIKAILAKPNLNFNLPKMRISPLHKFEH